MTGVFDAMTGERIGGNADQSLLTAPATAPTTNPNSSTNEEFMTVTYWEDANHGWLEVTATQLKAVGLTPSDLSDFSYLKYFSKPYGPAGLIAYYLEEDCDLGKFMVAHSKKFGTMPRILEKYHPFSPVRNYIRIRGQR
jgi:hypothetical protein